MTIFFPERQVVGDGPALPKMKLNLPSASFAGSLRGRKLANAYASADMFFFPSTTETFGRVTLEALASGLTVVTAAGPGQSAPASLRYSQVCSHW